MKTNWQTKKLGEVCDLVKGKKPKSFSNEGKKYLTAKVIRGAEEPKYTKDENTVYLKKDDIFIIMDGSNSGELFRGFDGVLASTMGLLKIDRNNFDINFLLYFLKGYRKKFTKSRTGSAIPHLNKNQFNDLLIPIISLPEQKRIVKILDEVFGDVKRAKENAEKNLANAKELFKSYLQSVFENPGKDSSSAKAMADKWEEKKLGEICDVIAGQSPEGKFYNKIGKGLPFYQGKKEFTNKFIGSPTTWTTKITKEALKNDILMSVRAPVGPINFATQKICIGRGLAAIRRSKKIDVNFLFYFLRNFEGEIVGNHGAVFNSINKKQIEEIQIPLPPLLEQKSIVKELDTLSAQTKKLEKNYQQKIDDLEELKKLVLKKAFEGEL